MSVNLSLFSLLLPAITTCNSYTKRKISKSKWQKDGFCVISGVVPFFSPTCGTTFRWWNDKLNPWPTYKHFFFSSSSLFSLCANKSVKLFPFPRHHGVLVRKSNMLCSIRQSYEYTIKIYVYISCRSRKVH